jgi:uncharacterized protein DUF2846
MSLFRSSIAAVIVLSCVMPAIAVEKEGSDEPESKELELKACGPKEKEVNYRADTDKSRHPTPAQPADKALIYVLRPTMMGNKIQTKLAVDGEWKGTNRGNNYFYFTLDPGEHYFCSVAENHSVLKANVEAGKTYYFQQHVRMGVMKARNEIDVMTEEEGKSKLAGSHLSTWEIK